MPGGRLHVPELWVTEPPAADRPAEAIPEHGEFTLHATFSGSGDQWKNMKHNTHRFEVVFHVEGIGVSEPEVDYGPVHVHLNQTDDEYQADYLVPANKNTLTPGLYRCGVTVVNEDWIGAVAFREGLVLQIYSTIPQ